MSMLLIGSVLGAVVMVVAGAIWLILRRGAQPQPQPQRPPQLEARVDPVNAGAAKTSRAEKTGAMRAHQDRYGQKLKPKSRGELAECIDDDEVALDEGLSFEASRVQRAASYFSQDQHPSFYALALEGHRLDVEVRFWGTSEDPTRHQAYVELHLSVPDGQDHQPWLELICQWLGVELKFELPFASTLDERGVIICELSGKYFGRTRWQGRDIELFSWQLGESPLDPLWFGVDHEQGRGWFWVSEQPRVRLKLAHHLSIHLRGGQPFARRAQAHLSGFVDEPLVRELSPLSVSPDDYEVFLRGQRVAFVHTNLPDDEDNEDDELSARVLVLDHLSDSSARELVSFEGGFGALDFDEGGHVLALTRFELDADERDVTVLEVFDLLSGESLWRLANDDKTLRYEVCVSPTGDRLAVARRVSEEEDALVELVVYDARTGAELERSWPQPLLALGRWLEGGIVCALCDEHEMDSERQSVWLPGASRWQSAARGEVSLPYADELIRLCDDGIELLNGQRWPYVQLNDLELWPMLYTLSLEALPWVGVHHLLWSANDDIVLNVQDGSARPLFTHDDDDYDDDNSNYYVVACGDGVVIVEDLNDDRRLYWASFSVSEVSASGGVLTGVAW